VWIESGNKLNINAVPSVVFFKNKKVVAKIEVSSCEEILKVFKKFQNFSHLYEPAIFYN